MFTFFKREAKPLATLAADPTDFDKTITTLSGLSKSAQMNFLARYVATLSPNMCRTLLTYAHQRLRQFTGKNGAV